MTVYNLSTVLLTAVMLIAAAFVLARCASHATRAEAAARHSRKLLERVETVEAECVAREADCDRLRESIARLNGRVGYAARKGVVNDPPPESEARPVDPEIARMLALQQAP